MKPEFLTLDEILEIHRDQIDRYGGEPGIRDMGLPESAAAMPMAGTFKRYLHHDLFEMAAAYMFHIIRNHPFLDGNKRTGAVAALVFLSLDGIGIEADESAFESIVRSVAAGEADEQTVADFLRKHARQTVTGVEERVGRR